VSLGVLQEASRQLEDGGWLIQGNTWRVSRQYGDRGGGGWLRMPGLPRQAILKMLSAGGESFAAVAAADAGLSQLYFSNVKNDLLELYSSYSVTGFAGGCCLSLR